MPKRALIIITEGSEEIESTTPVHTLRRAGIEVSVAGLLNANRVACSKGSLLSPEMSLTEAIKKGPYDAIILPGGLKVAQSLGESQELGNLLKEQDKAGRLLAGICAGPVAFAKNGIGIGKSATSYPTTKEYMKGFIYSEDRVVIDGNLITSRGPGTAMEWSFAILEYLAPEKVEETAKAMFFKKLNPIQSCI